MSDPDKPSRNAMVVKFIATLEISSFFLAKKLETSLLYLQANAPSLSLSPPYPYSCKAAPRPPYFITH